MMNNKEIEIITRVFQLLDANGVNEFAHLDGAYKIERFYQFWSTRSITAENISLYYIEIWGYEEDGTPHEPRCTITHDCVLCIIKEITTHYIETKQTTNAIEWMQYWLDFDPSPYKTQRYTDLANLYITQQQPELATQAIQTRFKIELNQPYAYQHQQIPIPLYVAVHNQYLHENQLPLAQAVWTQLHTHYRIHSPRSIGGFAHEDLIDCCRDCWRFGEARRFAQEMIDNEVEDSVETLRTLCKLVWYQYKLGDAIGMAKAIKTAETAFQQAIQAMPSATYLPAFKQTWLDDPFNRSKNMNIWAAISQQDVVLDPMRRFTEERLQIKIDSAQYIRLLQDITEAMEQGSSLVYPIKASRYKRLQIRFGDELLFHVEGLLLDLQLPIDWITSHLIPHLENRFITTPNGEIIVRPHPISFHNWTHAIVITPVYAIYR